MSGAGQDRPGVRRALVLGHAGFIGGHLVEVFRRASPGIEVVGRSLPELDLTRPEDALGLAPLVDRETVLVFCSGIKKQLGDTLEIFERNLAMAVNVSRLIEEKPPARLLFFSSAEVYGEERHNLAISEETPADPTSFYGIAKYASEGLLRKAAARAGGMPLVVLRPPFVYGPGDHGGVYGPPGFIRAALAGEPATLWGDGTELREFLYVGDLAEAARRLALGGFHGTVNVATGRSHTFREVLDILSGFVPGGLAVRERPRTKSKVDNAYDNTRFAAALPGFAFTPLARGLRETFEAARVASGEEAGR